MILPTRSQLIRELSLTQTDLAKIARCRGDPQRLGFAYQLGFVRVFQRFPVQQPLEKLAAIKTTGVLGIDLEWLNRNYQRALFHYVRKCSAHRLRELARPRRRTALVCFLRQSYRDAVDQAVDMFDKLLTRTFAQAERELDQHLREQRRTIRSALLSLRSVGKLILDDTITDANLRRRVFQTVSRQELSAQMEQLSDWVTGSKSDVFHGVVKRFSYLRQFSPVLLRTLEFFPDSEDAEPPCWPAVQLLRDLNDNQKRKLPKTAPIDFIPKRLLPLVVNGGSPDRRSWECAVLVKLREELRSGNLAVRHSKRFARLKDYFISDQQWDAARESFFLRSGLPADPNKVPAYLKDRLNKAYDVFLRTEPGNKYATAEDGRWHLSSDPSERLAPDAEARLHHLKGWLARHMPTIRLPDLLIEVDNDLRFTNHFLPASQRADRKADGVCLQLATVLAHGCNIGLFTMAQLTPGISYKQLKRVSDWQLTEEAQRRALAELVQAISRLDATSHWGEGRTSASDGQRFAMPRKVLQQTFSTRFSDYALEFYSFIADNYAPFSTARRSSAPTGMPRSCSMASYTMRAIWSWTSTTRTPTATQRSTSRPSPCSVGASVRASVASSTSGSTGLTATATMAS